MDNNNKSSKKSVFNRKRQNSFQNELSNELGKLPPQSIPLEEAVLGALLLEKKAFEDVVDILKADSFYKDAHQLIYQAMLELSAKGTPIDLLTVQTQLEKNGNLEIIGGTYAIVRLTTEVSSSSNVVYHAHEIVERAIKRKMIGVASTVRQNAFEDTTDAFELLDETQHELFEITEDNVRKKTSDMASVYLNTIKDLDEKRKNKTGITGIQSGFTALDRITAGWQRSDLIILAARPGMGKAQPLDAKLLSQEGWKAMGEIKVGDFLAGSDGKFHRVEGVFPQGEKAIYKVIFEDGSSTECCEEHLWITFQKSENKLAVRSLKEIQKTLLAGSGKPNHYIPLIMPVEWEEKKLPLNSYLVGLFISNQAETSLLAEQSMASSLTSKSEKMAETYQKLQEAFGNRMASFSDKPFIPNEYLWASVSQRTQLLEGILAFSGGVNKNNGEAKGKYKTDSKQLKEDFTFLIRSLGGIVFCEEKKNQKRESYFLLGFELPDNLLELASKGHTKTDVSPLFKYITKIEFVGNKEAACIKIASSDSLYVTDDFILTHNTAFLLSALANAAVKYDHCVAIFSLEMSAEQLLTRMMSSEAEIESQKLRNGNIKDHEWDILVNRTTQLSASKMFIDDTPAITMLELRAKARRLKAQHDLDMIVIDYLQLMSGDSKGGNREQEIAGISRALKQLAKELDVPVMALSQLSRAVETRGGDKKPMLSDLRESGCLTADTQIIEAQTGKLFTIKELADRESQEPFYCLALGEDKKVRPYLMSKIFYSGIKQVYKLKTRSGKSIKASANHPFLKLEGWTALENLKTGDRIGVPRNINIQSEKSKLSKEELNLSWRDAAAKVGISYSGLNMYSRAISREKLNRFAIALESEELLSLSNSDIFWDEIVDITPLGKESVFDATVPEVHNFIANDIIVHNSIEQDADMVIFLYRPEYYEITQDEMGNPTHGVADVIIAKNRHGSLETVQLNFVGKYTKFQDLDEASFVQGNTGYDSGFPNATDSFSPINDGFTTLQSKGNNMNPIDEDLKNTNSSENPNDFGDEPPF